MKSFQTLSFINIQVYPHGFSTNPLFHNKKTGSKISVLFPAINTYLLNY